MKRMDPYKANHQSFLAFAKQFSLFIILLFCCQLVGILFSAIYSQAELFLTVNRLHQTQADTVFKILTHLGDWPVTLAIAIALLFVRYRDSLVVLSTMLYTGFFTQVIKLIAQHPRPALYFHELEPIHTIKDYTLQNALSFPSGHATCAFSLAVTLSYLWISQRKRPWLFIIALVVALSRVYLSQHFFKDILAGSFIGTFFALHLLWLLECKSSWFHSNKWNGSLRNLFSK